MSGEGKTVTMSLGVSYVPSEGRLRWKPQDLKGNIFELVGQITMAFNLKTVGEPYELIDGSFAWTVEKEK
jgi:hypothetical protein